MMGRVVTVTWTPQALQARLESVQSELKGLPKDAPRIEMDKDALESLVDACLAYVRHSARVH